MDEPHLNTLEDMQEDWLHEQLETKSRKSAIKTNKEAVRLKQNNQKQ